MNPAVKPLQQYQELCFSLSEHQATLSKDGLQRIESSLQKARAKLPEDLHATVDLLRQRSPLILAPVVGNSCSACRQVLPSALAYSVRTSSALRQCPGCGRLLYIDDQPLRQTGKRVSPLIGKPTHGIAQYSSQALMVPQLAAKTADEAIRELATRIAEEGYVSDGARVAEMAIEREQMASSAVEKGLAFPHVRGIEGGGLTFAVGMKRGGLPFGAPDKVKTKLLFFTVIPTAASQFYLKLLSGLTQVFRDAKARNALLACKTADEMWETLDDLTGDVLH